MIELKAKDGCCEEASLLSHAFYIPCNQPAVVMVGWPARNEGPYRMCAACADHSVRNRGATKMGLFCKPDPEDDYADRAEWKAHR